MPDSFRIRIMPTAADELVAICSYIEQTSPQNAIAVAKRLIDAIDSLEMLPRRFKVHEHRRDPTKTVHSMPVPPFIVYYRVRAITGLVEVVSIRHGSRRQPRRFR